MTNDKWSDWLTHTLKVGGVALMIGLFIITITAFLTRIQTVAALSAKVHEVQIRMTELEKTELSHIEDIGTRLDVIESVLWGDVLRKLNEAEKAKPIRQPRPTQLEVWQQNRDKEIRAQILGLQNWRFSQTDDVEELEGRLRRLQQSFEQRLQRLEKAPK